MLTPMYRWTTIATGPVVIGLAYVYTFHYVYSPNMNTQVHGWPVPVVVLQRDAPGEPWLDFVGPTTILGLPINLVLFLGTWFFILWVLSAVITRSRKKPGQPRVQGDA